MLTNLVLEVYFNTLKCCIVTWTHPERPFSTSNCLFIMYWQCEKVVMHIAVSAKYTHLYFYYPTYHKGGNLILMTMPFSKLAIYVSIMWYIYFGIIVMQGM